MSNILTISGFKSQIPRFVFCASCFVMCVLCFGCATPPGEVFPILPNAPRWPSPPDPARIVYVGQLATSDDLKPGVSGLDALGRALFGKKDIHTMLSPFAVCSDNEHRLFVADSNAQCVHMFDFNTRKYATWAPGDKQPPFSQPVGIAWMPRSDPKNPALGQLLVSDSVSGCLYVFNAEGKFYGLLGEGILQRPVGVVVDSAHQRILVSDVAAHQVVVLSYDGKLLQRIGERGTALGQFNYPTNLTLDNQGRLLVSDSLNFRVQLFDADFKPIRQIGKKGDIPGFFAKPKGVATDSEGHIYVIDSEFENIQIFNDQGQVLMDFGQEGTGPGGFWLPTSVFIDKADRIYVADSYNRRIQVFVYIKVQEPATQPATSATTMPEGKP